MRRVIDVYEKIVEQICKIVAFASLGIMVIISIEVIARYVFNNPTTWGWVVNKQLLLIMTLFGGTYASSQNAHIRIEMLYERFSGKARFATKILTSILFVCFMSALIWKGAIMARESILVAEVAPGLFRLPVYPFKALIPIGAFFFLIQGVISILRNGEQ